MARTLLLLAAIIGAAYSATYGDGTVQAEFNVQCSDTHFAVFFNKTALDERTVSGYNNRSYVIRFYGQQSTSCWTHDYETGKQTGSFNNVASSGNYASTIYLGLAWQSGGSQCGINTFSDATHIIYNTTVVITYGANPAMNIGREEYDMYNVMCLRNRTIYEKLDGNSYNVDYRKTGYDAMNDTADFDFKLTHSDMNYVMQTTYKLGDFIKFTLESNTARDEVKAVIQKCWSTSDGVADEYALISNRCDMEQGTSWISVNETDSIFKTEAFRYLNVAGQAVHVECLVRVCLDSDGTPECTKCPGTKRKRREVTDGEQSKVGQMAIVKSPVFYIVDDRVSSTPTNNQSSSGPLSGTNGLIVIILLATLVFVIAAAIVKKVFFSAPAAPVAVTAYQNKAMA